MADAADTAPRAAFSLAMRASRCMLVKRGKATLARMPRMTMTTISSIIVKPRWNLVFMADISISGASRLNDVNASRRTSNMTVLSRLSTRRRKT